MAYIGREPQIGNYQVCDAISVVNGQAAYTMQVSSTSVIPESVNHMIVSLNGVIQKPGSSYTISSSTITFSSNLATGDSIDFIYLLGNVLDLGVPSDSTITSAKLSGNLITPGTLDVNGQELILDADADTSITADTDDQIDIKVAGADDFQITANTLTALSGSTIKADTIAETTGANGVAVDGLTIKDGKLNTNDSVVTANITDANVTTAKIADDAISLAKMASGTDGNIISYDASGNPVAIATGSSGQVLTSAGAGSPPAFADVSGGVSFKQAGTNFSNSLLVGHSTSGTLSSAERNTGVGIGTLDALTSGVDNIGLGYNALTINTTGTENIAIGAHALDAQISGDQNVAIGHGALGKCTDNKNTAIGRTALDNVTSGEGNVAVGFSSGAEGTWQNFTTEDNRAVFGHGSVTHSYVKVDWTVGSDERDKNNFGTVPHGLDFVDQLNPISYQFRKNRSEEEVHGPVRYGFKAQDILALEGDNPVIINNDNPNSLLYTDSNLTPVLVKAIQELKTEIDSLKTRITALEDA